MGSSNLPAARFGRLLVSKCLYATGNTHKSCCAKNVISCLKVKKGNTLFPVMVFIHGGFFIWGSGNPSIYGPEYLCTRNIVLVTINYRLGLLGFLSFKDSTVVPGNAGLKDQVMALKWIKKNIIHFQGDPNNITLFGQCAGAASVHLHILSRASQGLFHKAIMQSGCALNPWVNGSMDNGMVLGQHFCRLNSNEAEILDYLQKEDVARIWLAQSEIMEVSMDELEENVYVIVKFSGLMSATSGCAHR